MIFGSCKRNWNLRRTFYFLGWTYFFLALRSACIASAYGLGYTTDLPMASEKKSNLGKKSSSMVSFFYRPKNSLETEYIFLHKGTFTSPEPHHLSTRGAQLSVCSYWIPPYQISRVIERLEINVLLDTCIYLITAVWSGAYFVSIFEQILDSALF